MTSWLRDNALGRESREPNVREAQACLETGPAAKQLLHSEINIERTISHLLKSEAEIGLVRLRRSGTARTAIEVPDNSRTEITDKPRALAALRNGEGNAEVDCARIPVA